MSGESPQSLRFLNVSGMPGIPGHADTCKIWASPNAGEKGGCSASFRCDISAARKGGARLLPGAPKGLEGVGRALAAARERARVGERARRLVWRPQRHERQAQPRETVQHPASTRKAVQHLARQRKFGSLSCIIIHVHHTTHGMERQHKTGMARRSVAGAAPATAMPARRSPRAGWRRQGPAAQWPGWWRR